MEDKKAAVLVVDDEPFNLILISDYLSDSDLEIVCVEQGEEALSLLEQTPYRFSAILLDRMMPGMDGIEVLKRIKSNDGLRRLPVIMQTASTGRKNMLEGLNAGAHYYLSKPYDQATLVAIVNSAIRDYHLYLKLQTDLKQSAQTLMMMQSGTFNFKTLDEGRNLASLLANACPDSERVVIGLIELIVNAVEHGNLGITYAEKSMLNANGQWEEEIDKRLILPMYQDRYVTLSFDRGKEAIKFIISDQGDGFDWNQFMEISPDRAFDSHGRGIALAKTISFQQLEYLDNGSKVSVTIPLSPSRQAKVIS